MRPLIAPYLLRFPGLGWIPDAFFSFFMDKFTEHSTDINRLTIISEELASRIGGIEKIMTLGKDCPIAEYPGGYVIQAGERPEYGDMEKGDSLPLYGRVQNMLRPLYLPLRHLDYVAIRCFLRMPALTLILRFWAKNLTPQNTCMIIWSNGCIASMKAGSRRIRNYYKLD